MESLNKKTDHEFTTSGLLSVVSKVAVAITIWNITTGEDVTAESDLGYNV